MQFSASRNPVAPCPSGPGRQLAHRLGLAVLLTCGLAPGAAGQARDQVDSFRRAYRLLNSAIAYGGGDVALSASSLAYTVDGETYSPGQGYHVDRFDRPEHDGRFRLENVFDLAQGRLRQRSIQELRGGFRLSFTTIVTDRTITNLRDAEGVLIRNSAPSPAQAQASVVDFAARFFPPLLFRRARERLSTLRSPAPGILTFSWDERTPLTLGIDQSGRIGRLSLVQPDPVTGEAPLEYRFVGPDQTVAGLRLPVRIEVRRNGVLISDLSLTDVRVSVPPDSLAFVVPADYRELNEPAGLSVEKAADSVYEVRGLGGGLYRVPVFVFDEFLVTFDAPVSFTAMRQALQVIRTRISPKPIRFGVISHFHLDHSGGLAALTEAGATIVASETNGPFFRRIAGSRSRFDGLGVDTLKPAAPILILVDSSTTITDRSGARLEVFEVGATPHVERMLVAVHRPSNTLANGDLFSTLTPFNETFAGFLRWLDRERLDVARVMGVHHPPISVEALRAKADSARQR